MGMIGFVVSRKWPPQTISCQFRPNRCAPPSARFQPNPQDLPSLCPITVGDDDAVEEFYNELE